MNGTLIALAVASAVAFGSGWGVRGWRADSQRVAEIERAAKDQAIRVERVDVAAVSHEKYKAAVAVREKAVAKEVERVVQEPVYRNVCLDDDGLRILAEDIAARAPAGQSAPGLPGTTGAGGEGRSGRAAVGEGGDPSVQRVR